MRGCAAQPFPWRYASTGHTAVQGDMPRLTTRGAFARVMRPIAAMCVILHCRAYVRVYASHCGHVRDSALLDVCTRLCVPLRPYAQFCAGVCTRLCVLLRPCARFCVAGRMYAFMRPLATMCAILRRAYVRVYASSCDRARDSAPGLCTRLCLRAATLLGISKYQCIPLRAFAYTCARKNQKFSRADRIRTSARAKCPRVCPCGR